MASYDSQQLIHELHRRFPILDEFNGHFGEGSPEERVPWFFALLLSAALKRGPGVCCFVLDKTNGTAALAAVLFALARLKGDFPRLAESYARTAFCQGQLVRVKPNNFVFEYEGIWDKDPDWFRLKEQDKRAWRSFRVSEVLRLEPTARKRPKGTLSSKIHDLDRSPLDLLLNIATHGNDSMIRNVVLLYMAQARFAGIADVASLKPNNSERSDRLSSFLPWGTIGPGGVIHVGDAYQVIGEPLIAVSRVPQDLADAAKSAPEASKVVLVDGARGFVSDPDAFEDIVDRQRVVILASPDEAEEIQELRKREWPVWHLSPTEITIGEDNAGGRSRRSLVGRTVRVAEIRERCKVAAIECQSDDLQAVAEALEGVAAKIEDIEEKSETEDLLARLYGMLLEFSESCFEIGEETKFDLRLARRNFERDRMWMTPDIIGKFRLAIDRLEGVSNSRSGLGGKLTNY